MDPIDRTFFFATIRHRPFGGRLSAHQVRGCETILDYWEAVHGPADDRWLAYLLGTSYHETAGTMAAIRERGGARYFEARYGAHTAVGRRLGNREEGDGARYCGRGFVQLTGRANYEDWSIRLGCDLVGEPDLALEPSLAARILIEGSIRGTFTGRALPDFMDDTTNDWLRARQVINRMDRAHHIARLGRQFWSAIAHVGSGQRSQARWRRLLRRGDRGEAVRLLQTRLALEPDGIFGRRTEAALAGFQHARGLAADGVCGGASWHQLLEPGNRPGDRA
ncbi:peptidoglycan-binding protein [Qipengyuania sp.]|uniref:peptidoglycan-binding protein n=1 Tax=Qipengyuania sp. TaxID=2004515 RepID=UPI003735EAAA